MYSRIYAGCGLIVVSLMVLPGCSNHPGRDDSDSTADKDPDLYVDQTQQRTAKSLTEVAGQPSLPVPPDQSLPGTVSEQQMKYAGRYHTYMSCEDAFAYCDSGKAEFIINLLPDGTAHRSFVYIGKMSGDSKNASESQRFRQDLWSYDAATHSVIIHRASGIQFYYHVDAQDNLVMDLDRIINATEINRKFFAEGNPVPQQAYVLKRFTVQ